MTKRATRRSRSSCNGTGVARERTSASCTGGWFFNICIANVDDHLRNHGFLREGKGYRLSPAYDLNPVPADVRPRILSTAVTPDDATGSLDAALESAPYFGLRKPAAEAIVKEVRAGVANWRRVAGRLGAPSRECDRLASAFLTDP